MMKGRDIGVTSVTVYEKTGIVRLSLSPGCGNTQPCEVVFAGVTVNLR
jgi:hypothetical protein